MGKGRTRGERELLARRRAAEPPAAAEDLRRLCRSLDRERVHGGETLEARRDERFSYPRRDAAEPPQQEGARAGHDDLKGDPEKKDVVVEHPGDRVTRSDSFGDLERDERRDLNDRQAGRQ